MSSLAPEISSSPKPGDRATATGSGSRTPDPVGGLRFLVSLDDVQIGAFAECSGLSVEYEIFEYEEGGEHRFVHKLRGRMKYPNLVLKRGITHEDALLKWLLGDSDRTKRGAVTLTLKGDDGQDVRSWAFAGAFPVKWQGPSFNAGSNTIATETLEIAHQGLL
jgi:phage tail-like protein